MVTYFKELNSASLYGIGCVQCYSFFQRFNRDGPLLRYSVSIFSRYNLSHNLFLLAFYAKVWALWYIPSPI